MKKNSKTMSFVIILILTLAFAGCGGTEAPKSSGDVMEESENPKTADSGELGEYAFAIKDFELVKDYEGKDCILVRFDFTNNSNEAKSFGWSASPKAFQNGIELGSAILSYSDGMFDDNASKDIKPGITIEVYEVYVLSDLSSPVEVELAEFMSFSGDKLVKTFTIA